VDEEKSTLLGAQNAGPSAIEMGQTAETEHDSVIRRDRPRALRARRGPLFRHRSIPNAKGDGWA